jgi:hypothetical protein
VGSIRRRSLPRTIRSTSSHPVATNQLIISVDALERRYASESRVEISARRKLHDFIGFWEVCNDKRCRRVRACTGDIKACHERHWPHEPQEIKTWILAGLKARNDGASPEEAARIADEKVAAVRALNEWA